MGDESRTTPTRWLKVPLTEDEHAAVEGWRQANFFEERGDAARALVRLGLLSEIGRVFKSLPSRDDEA